ncbi:MAG TPA: phosphodiester glycosidase family protein [Chthoniobacterales bacterium]
MRKLVSVALLLCCIATARGDWKTLSSQSEPGAAKSLEHRYIVVEESERGDRASLEVALFSTKWLKLRVLDQATGPRGELAEFMQRDKYLAGVNGGYFTPDYEPIGLLIVDQRTIAPLQRARLLTGVLTASARGVQLLRVREFSAAAKWEAAIECGPFLVDAGKRVSGLEDSRAARRTFAAVARDDRVALGFCSDVTLADLSKILTAPLASDLQIVRALNLDGGSSSAFWFKRRDGGAFSIAEEKPVRDFVGVVAR